MNLENGLIDQLEVALASRELSKRAELLRQVADLFVFGSGKFTDEQIDLFDEVMSALLQTIESAARASFGSRLSRLADARSNSTGSASARGRVLSTSLAAAEPAVGKPKIKRSPVYSSQGNRSHLAARIPAEALSLHSNSSRVEVLSEHQELTLKPHSWPRVIFQNFTQACDRQKPCVFKAKDSALHPRFHGAIDLISRRSSFASS